MSLLAVCFYHILLFSQCSVTNDVSSFGKRLRARFYDLFLPTGIPGALGVGSVACFSEWHPCPRSWALSEGRGRGWVSAWDPFSFLFLAMEAPPHKPWQWWSGPQYCQWHHARGRAMDPWTGGWAEEGSGRLSTAVGQDSVLAIGRCLGAGGRKLKSCSSSKESLPSGSWRKRKPCLLPHSRGRKNRS